MALDSLEDLKFALRGNTKKTQRRRFVDDDGDEFEGLSKPLIKIDPVAIVELCDSIPESSFNTDAILRNLRQGSAATLRRPRMYIDDQGERAIEGDYADLLSADRENAGGVRILKRGRKVYVPADDARHLLDVAQAEAPEEYIPNAG